MKTPKSKKTEILTTTREPIKDTDTAEQAVAKLVENNQEAAKIIANIMGDMRPHGIDYLLKLDRQNIRGKQIVAALEYAGSTVELCGLLTKPNHKMVEFINQQCFDEWLDYTTRVRFI